MRISSLDDLKHVKTYLSRVGAEPRSMKTAVIREMHGTYWKDLAVIRFAKDGEVKCDQIEFLPTEFEAAAIKTEFSSIQWPIIKPLDRIVNTPDMIKEADRQDIYEFRNLEGKIVMVQVRIERKGSKNYIPFTYWDDDLWRVCEPDGPLPLYNEDKLADASTVFIHEGAKAARYCQWMVDGETAEAREALLKHPWGQELSGAVHVGWIGGAMSPYRTNWGAIVKSGVKRAYIVADNDEPGRSAVPGISQQLRIPTFLIQFTQEFPVSFDLADAFPEDLHGHVEEVAHYVGPTFRDCTHPATWATDLMANPKGKPSPVLRDSFKQMWAYVEEADMFICTEMPDIIRSEPILNKMLAPFSHASETSRLIVRSYRGRSARVCYRPDHKGLMVTFRGSSAINLHTRTTVKTVQGDPGPWLEFLEYMFVDEKERRQVARWCATLIARPGNRIGYGLLLVSEKQGVGKTTLGSHILAPLVGVQNVGYPSEGDIANSSFNDWMANKRLVVVNEIYSGASWKAYHALKSVITDRDVTVNQKYMRQYAVENWCHVLACSNSMRALKMENDDRRWFYPEVTEVSWKKEKFIEFRKWIEGGGLSIIKHWAENLGDYITPADRAPMTKRKREMIDGSRSEAQAEAAALAECLKDREIPGALLIKDVVGWVRQHAQSKVFDSDYELRRTMSECGLEQFRQRIKVAGRSQYVLMNSLLSDKVKRSEKDKQMPLVRSHIVKPAELMEGEM
jgi:hypothetical protein